KRRKKTEDGGYQGGPGGRARGGHQGPPPRRRLRAAELLVTMRAGQKNGDGAPPPAPVNLPVMRSAISGGAPRLVFLPLLLHGIGEPEVDAGKSKKKQRQPGHRIPLEKPRSLDQDIEAEERIDDARQVEHHDTSSQPLVHRNLCDLGLDQELDSSCPGSLVSNRLRGPELAGELVEYPVDIFVAVGAAVALRQFHRLVDDDAVRHVGPMLDLVAGEEQDPALVRAQPRERAVEERSDIALELRGSRNRPIEQRLEIVCVNLAEAGGLRKLPGDGRRIGSG